MLPLETQRLWDFLQGTHPLSGFVLVGGTALTLHLNHRLSEDLDFMVDTVRLPRARIDATKRLAEESGFLFVPNDNPMALARWEEEDTGLDFHDFQQDYLVNEQVKVTFVAPEHEVRAQLKHASLDRPRVASIEEIFDLKCIASANRKKSRDWLDLYLMLKKQLFTPLDIYEAFEAAKVPQKAGIALKNLCSGQPDELDERFESLMPDTPTMAEMAAFFRGIRDQMEIQVAEREARKMR